MRLLRQPPSAALVLALVAVVLASAGSAVAAQMITSRQIKNGTIQRADLSKSVRSSLAKRGPRGAQGPGGPAGIGKGYFVTRVASGIQLGTDFGEVVALKGLAPGSYIIEGRAAAVNFTAEQFVRCHLRAGTSDFGPTVVHVANDTSEAGTIAPAGTFSSSAPFDAAMRCRHDSPQPGPYLDHISLWAIRVEDLEVRTQP
jgi:hypothetical protein